MRVRVLFLTFGIRVVLSYSLNISCSSPSHVSLGPQPAAGTPTVPAHLSSPAQMSCAHLRQPLPHVAAPTSASCLKDSLSARSPRARSTGRRPRLLRERNASERRQTAATMARAARLAMAELTAAKTEVEAAAAADATRAAVAKLEALRASNIGNSVSADNDRDNELKLAREATQE
jgi:hypothetical protein